MSAATLLAAGTLLGGREEALTPRLRALLVEALDRPHVTSDALLLAADMLREAAGVVTSWPRDELEHLAGLLRDAAPAFADRALPTSTEPALSGDTLRAAARTLLGSHRPEFRGVVTILRAMADAAEGRGA